MKEKRGRVMLKLLVGGSLAFTGICLYSGNHMFYSNIVMPASRLLDAETSHKWCLKLASLGILPRVSQFKHDSIKTKLLGFEFDSPIGLAAGFDKDAESFDSLADLGFGFTEVGTITPKPQFGNPKPRVFRLLEDKAIINRYGFNSAGIDNAKRNLENRKKRGKVVGVNLGVNKNSANALEDYELGIKNLGPYADYLVINVSSPNTPGLRSLQTKKHFDSLLKAVTTERNKLQNRPPLLVKIAPDLDGEELKQICKSAESFAIDGLIVCNTTVSRENLKSPKHLCEEVGGLSGSPLCEMSNKMIRDVYRLTQGRIPIIGVGGVFTAEDVVEKLRCGASLVQVYTGFAYQGPTVVNEMNKELANLMQRENISNISEIVGSGVN